MDAFPGSALLRHGDYRSYPNTFIEHSAVYLALNGDLPDYRRCKSKSVSFVPGPSGNCGISTAYLPQGFNALAWR
jgi:hypothetical protein